MNNAVFLLTLLPVLAASIANIIVGYVWYHPRVFGGIWMRLTNVTPEIVERGNKRARLSMLMVFVAAIFAAYALNTFRLAFGVADIVGAVEFAILAWLGFVAPAMLGSYVWEHKPFALYCINAGYWLASFVLMTLILLL